MARKSISDNQISASSQLDGNHSAIQARLHSKAGAWSPLNNDLSQWLQVDLGSDTRVTRVATQGSNAYNESVTKYKLQYSDDGVTFQFYKDVGDTSAKVFARLSAKYAVLHWFINSCFSVYHQVMMQLGRAQKSETERVSLAFWVLLVPPNCTISISISICIFLVFMWRNHILKLNNYLSFWGFSFIR